MNDCDQETQPASELEPQFRRIRARIVRSLILLAGAEPVRAVSGPGLAPGLTVEERRGVLKRVLADLKKALSELKLEIAKTPPQAPGAAAAQEPLGSTSEDAWAIIDRLLGEADAADGPHLEQMPEQAREPVARLINEWCPVPKIFVAVHGIGDQFQNETVQSVAFRVCDYLGQPAALPLGRFHGPGATVTGAFLPDPDRDPPIECGFAEIYWANVPRIPAADRHILEEPKKWARTLVARMRLRDPNRAKPPRPRGPVPIATQDPAAEKKQAARRVGEMAESEEGREDDKRLEQLLEEVIQGVVVADRLVYLAEKAGLFKFELKKLLDDYLNDVQVVTEFEDYRNQLLDIFNEVLEKIHRYFYKSEIYIVAHSEGTVVTFMGLLKGLSERAEWATMVGGLMTIGSPLNKHIRFWPELFDQFNAKKAIPPDRPIPWKNYYDHGDPIGYNLQPTRDWMVRSEWDQFFVFRDDKNVDDIGFTRYYFPGAAHNDYWRDTAVFGHFIQTVVDPPDPKTTPVLPPARKEPYEVPGTVGLAWLTSYMLPYVLSFALLFLACYLLYKAVRGCLDPIGARFELAWEIFRNVLGLSGLIAAMTFLARIPILSRRLAWRVWAFVLAALSSGGYALAMSRENRESIGRFLVKGWDPHPLLNAYNGILLAAIVVGLLLWLVRGLRPALRTLIPVMSCVLVLRIACASLSGSHPWPSVDVSWHTFGVVIVAWSIGLMAWFTSWRHPSLGTKLLVHTGGFVILIIIISQLVYLPETDTVEHRDTLAKAAGRDDRDALGALLKLIEERDQEAFSRLQDAIKSEKDSGAVSRMVASPANRAVVAAIAEEQGQVWPIFLAGAAFLYLWWLAIVTFDLTFLWHLYIRHSGAQKYVESRLKEGDGPNPGRAGREPGVVRSKGDR